MLIFKNKVRNKYKIYDTDDNTYELVSQSNLDTALSLGISIVGLNREAEIQKARVFNGIYFDNFDGMVRIRGTITQKRILLSKYVTTLNIDPTSDIKGVTLVLDDTLTLGYTTVTRNLVLKLFAQYNVKLDISLLSDSGCQAFYHHILSTIRNEEYVNLVPLIVVDTVKYRNVYVNTVVAYILSNTVIDLMSKPVVLRMLRTYLKGEEDKVYLLLKQGLTDSKFYRTVYNQNAPISGYKNLSLLSRSSYYILHSRSVDSQVYDHYVGVCKLERYLYPFLLFCTLGLGTETEVTALTYMQDYARCLLKCVESLEV